MTHTGTDVVQKDDYYPFGGSFNAYTDLSTPQQDYLYNGVRLNKTTQLYETAFRTYDPYLGRFNHVDPLAAMVPGLSPYHFGFNNPVRYSDPLGLMGQDAGMWGTGNAHASNASKNPLGGYTGPGSGNHWSDGWENSDWNGWTGSDAYRAEKAYAKSSGGYEYGGTFKDGNDNQVKVVNGLLQVWYPMGGDLAYSEVGDGYVNKYYYGAWGDPIGGTLQAGFGDGANFTLTQVGATIGLRGYLTHNDKFWTGRNGKVYSQNSLYKDYYGKGGKYVRGVQGLRNSANIASKSASQLTSLGRTVGYEGVILTAYDAVSDGYISTGDVARIGIGILTIATPAGWVYGAADLGTQLITGQSITDRIGNSVDRHLVLWGQLLDYLIQPIFG